MTNKNLNWFPPLFDNLALHQRNQPPLVVFPAETVKRVEAEMAPLRHKTWASSKRANPRADAIGLIGELAFFKLMGMTGTQALSDFLAGLKGDLGVDYTL